MLVESNPSMSYTTVHIPSTSSNDSTPRPTRTTSTTQDDVHAVRLNAFNNSMQEARDARSNRTVLIFLSFVYVPQIIAAIVVLALHWPHAEDCARLKLWVSVQTVYLAGTLATEWLLVCFVVTLEREKSMLTSLSNSILWKQGGFPKQHARGTWLPCGVLITRWN